MANDVARLILQHVECDNPDHIKRLYGDISYRIEQLLIDQLRQAITYTTQAEFKLYKLEQMFPYYWKCVETMIVQDSEFTFELGETLVEVRFKDENIREIMLKFLKRYDLHLLLSNKERNHFGDPIFSLSVSWDHWDINYIRN
jgi:hypothetical protein